MILYVLGQILLLASLAVCVVLLHKMMDKLFDMIDYRGWEPYGQEYQALKDKAGCIDGTEPETMQETNPEVSQEREPDTVKETAGEKHSRTAQDRKQEKEHAERKFGRKQGTRMCFGGSQQSARHQKRIKIRQRKRVAAHGSLH